MFAGSLAECVRYARQAEVPEPEPGSIKIVHGRVGLIQIDQLREMAADPSFPVLAPDTMPSRISSSALCANSMPMNGDLIG
jgi:hypothetical protein